MSTGLYRACNPPSGHDWPYVTVVGRSLSHADRTPCLRAPESRPASSPLVAPDHRLALVHARYTAVVDLDVEFLCRSLKLDPETVSDRASPTIVILPTGRLRL